MASTDHCPTCQGTGWTEVATPRGLALQRCTCYRRGQTVAATQALGLPPRLTDRTFESFRAADFNSERNRYHALIAAMRQAQKFVEEFPMTKAKGLLFHGGLPDEQSHLAVATLKRFAGKGFTGLYCDYQTLLSTLQSRYDRNPVVAEAAKETARRVADVDVLVLDFLGEHRPTGWALDLAGGIIKHCYNSRKCLLATTGLPLEAPSRARPANAAEMSPYAPQDCLADRIGGMAVQRLLDHCRLVPMAAQRAPSRGSGRRQAI